VSFFIFTLTLRQLLARRSSLIPLGLALLPLLVAAVFRMSDPDVDPERWTARFLAATIVTALLPLTALLLGVSVLGEELEEGTAVYLLTKPMSRWQILAPKVAAPALVTLCLVAGSGTAAGIIVLEGQGDLDVVQGFLVGTAAGSIAYTALFVLTSLVTTRALIAGLSYVFIWEGIVTTVFAGTRYFSVRHYVLGLSDWVSDTPDRIFDAYVGGFTALVLLVGVTVVAVVMAERRLERIEVREQT
jgi:ABC-2 type transport system permease protein